MEPPQPPQTLVPRVFRLRRIPNSVKCHEEVSQIFSFNVPGIARENIRVCSLATSLRPWEALPSRVATLMFRGPLPFLNRDGDDSECTFPIDGCTDSLILDSHFLGMTPLNDVAPNLHQAE